MSQPPNAIEVSINTGRLETYKQTKRAAKDLLFKISMLWPDTAEVYTFWYNPDEGVVTACITIGETGPETVGRYLDLARIATQSWTTTIRKRKLGDKEREAAERDTTKTIERLSKLKKRIDRSAILALVVSK